MNEKRDKYFVPFFHPGIHPSRNCISKYCMLLFVDPGTGNPGFREIFAEIAQILPIVAKIRVFNTYKIYLDISCLTLENIPNLK